MKINRKEIIVNSKKKGFSLIEALIAIFVFSLAVVLVSGVFSNFLRNYANSKRMQKNIENAQYATNIMAKTLRTSKLVTTSFPLRVFDYSRSQNNCVVYDYSENKIKMTTTTDAAPANPAACNWGNLNAYSDLTANDVVSASINAQASTTSPAFFGKATIALLVKESGQTGGGTPIQMSVSLRQ